MNVLGTHLKSEGFYEAWKVCFLHWPHVCEIRGVAYYREARVHHGAPLRVDEQWHTGHVHLLHDTIIANLYFLTRWTQAEVWV